MPPVAAANLRALLERPCMAPGYLPRNIRAEDGIIRPTLRRLPYHGPVRIGIADHPGFDMIHMNDDRVAALAFYFGPDSYESLSLYLFAHLARDVPAVIDVGAYTGIYGLAAAAMNHTARVTFCEPMANLCARIRENLRLNGIESAEVVPRAVSDFEGRSELTVFGPNASTTGATLKRYETRRIRTFGTAEVAVTTLDALAGTAVVGLIKVDVEGAEPEVFEGASALLKRHRPTILSEVLTDAALAAQVAALAPHGYRAHYIDDGARRLLPVGDGFTLAPLGYGNVLFTARADPLSAALALTERFAARPFAR